MGQQLVQVVRQGRQAYRVVMDAAMAAAVHRAITLTQAVQAECQAVEAEAVAELPAQAQAVPTVATAVMAQSESIVGR